MKLILLFEYRPTIKSSNPQYMISTKVFNTYSTEYKYKCTFCSVIVFYFLLVEKDGLCGMEVDIVQENHNASKPAYAVGNVMFEAIFDTEITEYLLYYSFGDNTSATLKVPYTTQTHNYTDVCNNCSYDVTLIMLPELQYCMERNTIDIISE